MHTQQNRALSAGTDTFYVFKDGKPTPNSPISMYNMARESVAGYIDACKQMGHSVEALYRLDGSISYTIKHLSGATVAGHWQSDESEYFVPADFRKPEPEDKTFRVLAIAPIFVSRTALYEQQVTADDIAFVRNTFNVPTGAGKIGAVTRSQLGAACQRKHYHTGATVRRDTTGTVRREFQPTPTIQPTQTKMQNLYLSFADLNGKTLKAEDHIIFSALRGNQQYTVSATEFPFLVNCCEDGANNEIFMLLGLDPQKLSRAAYGVNRLRGGMFPYAPNQDYEALTRLVLCLYLFAEGAKAAEVKIGETWVHIDRKDVSL